MSEDKVISFTPPGQIDDPLTEVLRAGARQFMEQAVEAELEAFLAAYADFKTEDGRQRLVQHGHGPQRNVLTGIGSVPVRRAKARDRGAERETDRIRCGSALGHDADRRRKILTRKLF